MKIYTIGYGKAKWREFFKRLLDAEISCVVDIRREGSRSRNGKAFWWGFGPENEWYMGDRLFEAGIEYFTLPQLSRPDSMTLSNYAAEFRRMVTMLEVGKAEVFRFFMGYYELHQIIQEYEAGNICLLCCERDYKQCHRRIVAEMMAQELGLDIVHL